MREAGRVGASPRRQAVTTTRRDRQARPAPDLVDRDFAAEAPSQLRVADVTFVPTAAGFLYLAVVLDAWSRKVVGRSMANLPRAPSRCWRRSRRPWRGARPREAIPHPDRGSPGASVALGLRRKGEAGAGRPAPLDGPGRRGPPQRRRREGVLATLGCEPPDRRRFASQAEARMAVLGFVESLHDPLRLHSTLR